MGCCEKKPICVYKGFGTKWDNNDLISVSFDSEIDIDGFGAEFYIGDVVKTYQNVQDGFAINLTAQETETLPLGPTTGTLVLIDLESNKHPFSTELPFLVKDWEDGDVKLDGFNITINGRLEENKLDIKIETSNPEKINEETIRGYISVHNNSEEAHPYIRGLVSEKQDNIPDLGSIREGASAGSTAIQPNDNITKLNNNAGYVTSPDLNTAIGNHNTSGTAHNDIRGLVSSETYNREQADIGLQQQIDAVVASSDVKDIVGTHADLENYDTSTLGNKDIIKVLQDETQDGATTYYRWNTTTESFTLIGEEGPYYTKSQADSEFVPQTRTINGNPLSSDITLDAEDVGITIERITEVGIEPTNEVLCEQAGEVTIGDLLATISGYDSTKTQILKNVNGTFTWIDE